MDKNAETILANNILEFLIDPTRFPVERRVYFRPEEILRNESYDKAKAESAQAYGDQKKNSDFYPGKNRPSREATIMDRKTVIASLDVLAQHFFDESDPIAKDLRTIAFCVSKMEDGEYQSRLASSIEAKMKPPMKKCPSCGETEGNYAFSKKCKKCGKPLSGGKDAAEDKCPKCGGEAGKCTCKDASDEASWSVEASAAVQEALVSDIIEAATDDEPPVAPKEKAPKEEVPPATPKEPEAAKAKKDVPAPKAKPEDAPAQAPADVVPPVALKEPEAAKAPPADVVPPAEKKPEVPADVEAKKAEPKQATKPQVVDTNILAYDGIEMEAGMQEAGEMSAEEQARLNQLFQQ